MKGERCLDVVEYSIADSAEAEVPRPALVGTLSGGLHGVGDKPERRRLPYPRQYPPHDARRNRGIKV
jgi:hypothetical protein